MLTNLADCDNSGQIPGANSLLTVENWALHEHLSESSQPLSVSYGTMLLLTRCQFFTQTIPQQTHDVKTTSNWRRHDGMTSHRRQLDVHSTSCARWELNYQNICYHLIFSILLQIMPSITMHLSPPWIFIDFTAWWANHHTQCTQVLSPSTVTHCAHAC